MARKVSGIFLAPNNMLFVKTGMIITDILFNIQSSYIHLYYVSFADVSLEEGN